MRPWRRPTRGGTGQFKAFCPTAKGAPRWWEVVVTAVRADDGRIQNLLAVSRDVTAAHEADLQRERLLKELQAANARMADIFRQAPAFMCVLNGPEHVFEMVNERYLQLVGNRDLVGQPVRQALPEIGGQGFFELLDGVYRTGDAFTGTDMPVMLQRHPGAPLEQRFVDLVYMALRDADGKITGLLAHGVDQTERKLAENQPVRQPRTLRQNRRPGRHRRGRDGYAGPHHPRQPEVLRHARLHRGRADRRERGRRHRPRFAAADPARIAGLEAGGPGFVIDKHYLRKDGSLMPATSSVNALRGPDGEFQGLVAIVLDTTETPAGGADIARQRGTLPHPVRIDGPGLCHHRDDLRRGRRAGRLRIPRNERDVRAPYGPGQRHRQDGEELVPNLDRFWFDTYGKVALTGEAVRFENEAVAMERWFDVYATRLGGAGSRKVALLFSDITARRRSEEQLRQLAADLSDADRRKTEFLATLAHELRNPLAPIRSGLGVMRLAGDNPAALLKVREMMERQVGHMVHLIDDLLDVARISGGKLELKRERTDLKRVLSSAVETSMPLIEAARHRLQVSLPDACVGVDADVTRIAQVVSNLLNNAAKYTPAGGRIELSLREDAGMAVITVSDSGVGIPADSLVSVFDMFKQVDRHMERAQGGLGIGLSLVRRLVEMHGGAVSATSAGAGRGSTLRSQAAAGPGRRRARTARHASARRTTPPRSRACGCWWWTTTSMPRSPCR